MAEFKMNVGRTLNAFTQGTFTVDQALAEFLDNSEAADANDVTIGVERGKKNPVERIIIADNGSGMAAQELLDSLEFAGKIRDRPDHDVSHFGVGGKAAAHALAEQVTYATRARGHNVAGALLDFNTIGSKGTFDGPFDTQIPNSHYEELWKKYSIDQEGTGTVIILDGLKQREYSTCAALIGKDNGGIRHQHRLATRYRSVIDSGRFKIHTINGTGQPMLLQSYDPLQRGGKGTETLLQQSLYYKKKNVKFNVRITRIPNPSAKDFGVYIKVAGIVIARDNDRIMNLCTPGASHSYHWSLRMEVEFDTKSEFGKLMDFSSHKHSVMLNDPAFGDWLRDTDVGRVWTAEQEIRKAQMKTEGFLRSTKAFEEANSDFLKALNTNKSIYGPANDIVEQYYGKLTSFKPGEFNDRSVVAEMRGADIVYNTANAYMAEMLSNRSSSHSVMHAAARAYATWQAIKAEGFSNTDNFFANMLMLGV